MALRSRLHFDLWCVTKRVEGRFEFEDVLDEYWEYLRFAREAHEHKFIIETASILEKDAADKITLRGLINETRATEYFDQEDKDKIDEQLGIHTRVRKSIILLRHKLIAHRDSRWTYKEAWKRAEITVDQLDALTSTCLAVTNDILRAHSFAVRERYVAPVEEFERLLRALRPAT